MTILEKLRQPAPEFLSVRKHTLYFILFVLLFAVTFILLYHPVGFRTAIRLFPRWSERAYLAITVGIGFVTLVVSRMLLLRQLQHNKMTLGGYLIWIIGEYFFFAISLSLLVFLMNESSGISFFKVFVRVFINITYILSIPYILFALSMLLWERNQQIERLKILVEQKLDDAATSGDTINFYDKGGRLAFATRRSNVLYVESRDNYTNVHYISDDNKVQGVILHNSMKQLEQLYERWGLLRCHRSYMVNIENVKLLRREKDGFLLELSYVEKPIPVSKSYSDTIVKRFTAQPA